MLEGPVEADRLPRLAQYRIFFPIARGGMATVYLANSRGAHGFERRVAIKVVHPHLRGEDGAAAADLVHEASLAGRIRHPNVVPVLDVGDGQDGVFLVMEYIEGETLSAVLRAASERPLSLAIASRILCDCLAGLHAAHELRDAGGALYGIVHRDFSPQNILLGTDGAVRLTDFGIAKARTRALVTETGLIKGKNGYMSPEQVRGEPLDRRSDVWAAGVVAWEVLTATRLYSGDGGPTAALLRMATEPPPLVSTIRREVPEAAARAIARALEFAPDARTPTAEEFRLELAAGLREAVEPAELSAIGAFVRDLAKDRLAEWEARIRSAETEISSPSQPSHFDRGAKVPEAGGGLSVGGTGSQPRAEVGARRWVVVAGAAGVVALGATAALGLLAYGKQPSAGAANLDAPKAERRATASSLPPVPGTIEVAPTQASAAEPTASVVPSATARAASSALQRGAPASFKSRSVILPSPYQRGKQK